MKKLSALAILLISVLAFSCGDDDEAAAKKCVTCSGIELGCVGDLIDPNNADLGEYTEADLQTIADASQGTCSF